MTGDIDAYVRNLFEASRADPTREFDLYDELARLYDYLYGESYDHEGQAAFVAERSVDAPDRVLDVGCGAGRLCAVLADRYPDATVRGIDLHEGMVELARERCGESVDIETADVFELDGTGRYDVVTAFGVTAHFDDAAMRAFLSTAADLLTTRGTLVVDYKSPTVDVNGRFEPYSAETDEFEVDARWITAYDDGQQYYATSYEFTERATGETATIGDLFPVFAYRESELATLFDESPLGEFEIHEGVLDQHGAVVARPLSVVTAPGRPRPRRRARRARSDGAAPRR